MEEIDLSKTKKVPPKDLDLADGVWVRMRGRREYLIAALSFKALKALQAEVKKIEGMKGVPDPEQIDVVVKAVGAALRWNYDIQDDEVEDLVDLGNFVPVWHAMLGASGVKASPAGE